MAAEGLPTGGPASTLPSWELEAWYQDLQEVLAAAEPSGPSLPWGADQVRGQQHLCWGGGAGQGALITWGWLFLSPCRLRCGAWRGLAVVQRAASWMQPWPLSCWSCWGQRAQLAQSQRDHQARPPAGAPQPGWAQRRMRQGQLQAMG